MWKVNEIAYLNNLLLVVARLFYHVCDTAGQYVSLKAWFWCAENVLKFCNFYVLKKVKLLCSGLLIKNSKVKSKNSNGDDQYNE